MFFKVKKHIYLSFLGALILPLASCGPSEAELFERGMSELRSAKNTIAKQDKFHLVSENGLNMNQTFFSIDMADEDITTVGLDISNGRLEATLTGASSTTSSDVEGAFSLYGNMRLSTSLIDIDFPSMLRQTIKSYFTNQNAYYDLSSADTLYGIIGMFTRDVPEKGYVEASSIGEHLPLPLANEINHELDQFIKSMQKAHDSDPSRVVVTTEDGVTSISFTLNEANIFPADGLSVSPVEAASYVQAATSIYTSNVTLNLENSELKSFDINLNYEVDEETLMTSLRENNITECVYAEKKTQGTFNLEYGEEITLNLPSDLDTYQEVEIDYGLPLN